MIDTLSCGRAAENALIAAALTLEFASLRREQKTSKYLLECFVGAELSYESAAEISTSRFTPSTRVFQSAAVKSQRRRHNRLPQLPALSHCVKHEVNDASISAAVCLEDGLFVPVDCCVLVSVLERFVDGRLPVLATLLPCFDPNIENVALLY